MSSEWLLQRAGGSFATRICKPCRGAAHWECRALRNIEDVEEEIPLCCNQLLTATELSSHRYSQSTNTPSCIHKAQALLLGVEAFGRKGLHFISSWCSAHLKLSPQKNTISYVFKMISYVCWSIEWPSTSSNGQMSDNKDIGLYVTTVAICMSIWTAVKGLNDQADLTFKASVNWAYFTFTQTLWWMQWDSGEQFGAVKCYVRLHLGVDVGIHLIHNLSTSNTLCSHQGRLRRVRESRITARGSRSSLPCSWKEKWGARESSSNNSRMSWSGTRRACRK